MKKYVKNSTYHIDTAKSIELDPETYDDSNDPDDTYYSFDTVDDLLRWLNREKNCIK